MVSVGTGIGGVNIRNVKRHDQACGGLYPDSMAYPPANPGTRVSAWSLIVPTAPRTLFAMVKIGVKEISHFVASLSPRPVLSTGG